MTGFSKLSVEQKAQKVSQQRVKAARGQQVFGHQRILKLKQLRQSQGAMETTLLGFQAIWGVESSLIVIWVLLLLQ